MSAEPWKNSTLKMPPASEAFALKVIFAGEVNVAPLVGAVRLTTGGLFLTAPAEAVVFTWAKISASAQQKYFNMVSSIFLVALPCEYGLLITGY